jgi:hypothetical protein
MRHGREQDLAAEASVERVQVEPADHCLGHGKGLRVPPRGADELSHEQLVEVRVSFPIDLPEFFHPVVRSAVYETLDVVERDAAV